MSITDRIKAKLEEIEREENVKVILAVESGSRAWGFESEDSDYDVRFIYVRTVRDYLKLSPVRDVIEYELNDVYDISGWDIRKALVLLMKSNPSLIEWVNSPIIYRITDEGERLRELVFKFFNRKKSMFHYWSMSRSCYKDSLDRDEINYKGYLYALRTMLCFRWILEKRTVPPMRFEELLFMIEDEELKDEIMKLVDIKKNAPESGKGEKIEIIDRYITENLDNMRELAEKEGKTFFDFSELDEYFLDVLPDLD